MFVIIGLSQAISSYAQMPADELVLDTHLYAAAAVDPCLENFQDHEDPEDYLWDSSDVIQIVLNGAGIATSSVGATVDGSKVTITRGGTYSISGALTDGQIIVDSTDKKTVRLILNGADIRCSWSAPILVEKAKKTVVVLAEDTNNYVADGRSGVVVDAQPEEPNAAIFSKDDLSFWGGGSLTVCGNVNDGISTKDGLVVAGGVIDINAVDDGIRGKDYLVVRGGTITVNAGGDGLKSDNDEDATKGYISIETGVIDIASGADGIQAETDVLIMDGQFTLRCGGGSNGRNVSDPNAKGIAAGVNAIVHGGNVTIDSADDAIHSNGLLAIDGGTLTLSTMDDAIHADSVADVNGGDIRVTRCYEGIEANTVTITGGDIQVVSSDDGIVAGLSLWIADGIINVTSAGDAISAETDVAITGGQFTLTSGGGSAKTPTALSSKAIKGLRTVVIDAGDFTVNSADDAIHSNGDVTINGGALVLSSGDDGIHADNDVVINGGDIHIAKSYEGIESANANITINGGSIHVVSSDDGINVSAGGDAMGQGGMPGGVPGQPPGGGGYAPRAVGDSYYLYIHGGYLAIDALGDGIDSNGSIAMTDGVVLVNGPTANNNGALDHISFDMTGGFLVAAGSSGMAQAPSATSTQYSVLVTFNTVLPARTLVHIQDSQGQQIVTFMPTKQYNSVAFSSPRLLKGATYDVYYGGSSTGTVSDSLYQDGTYTPGTKCATFTISSMVTNVNAGAGTNVPPTGPVNPRR